MSRLTYKSESGMTWFVDEEGRRLEPCEMSPHHSRLAIEKLAHYEDLEEAGGLIETKFAIGQTVYDIRYEETYDKAWHYINKSTFTHAHIPAQDRYYETKAEAEAKLAELKGDA